MNKALPALVLFLLMGQLHAQSPAPSTTPRTLHRVSDSTRFQYSLTEGVSFTAPSTARLGPETIFDNTDGYEYYFTYFSPQDEPIDEFAFPARNLDGLQQVNGFTFEYCVALPTITSVDVEVRLYRDTVHGSGPSTWSSGPNCLYGLVGLPGQVGSTSCWEATVDLSGGFECSLPEETVPGGFTDYLGIGYLYLTDQVGPVLDSTFSSGGFHTAVPGYGSENYFEIFNASLPNPHVGTFFWSGPKFQSSFQLRLYGDGIPDTKVVNHDNPDVNEPCASALISSFAVATKSLTPSTIPQRASSAWFSQLHGIPCSHPSLQESRSSSMRDL